MYGWSQVIGTYHYSWSGFGLWVQSLIKIKLPVHILRLSEACKVQKNIILCLQLRHWNQQRCLLQRTRHIKHLGLAVPSCFIRGTSGSDDFYFYFCHRWHTYFVVSMLPLKAIKKSELSSYGLSYDFSKHHCVGTLAGKRSNACITVQLGCCQATAIKTEPGSWSSSCL